MTKLETQQIPEVEAVLARHPNAKRDSLIPILQETQEALGYLSREAVVRVGEHLNLPAAKIYGVATFYNQFRFKPRGRHHIQVCRGTACHVKGSASVLDSVQHALDLKAGDTSRDGLFSLEVVACIGACGLAPVISIDGEFFAGMTPEKVRDIVNTYRRKADNDGQTG